MPIIVFVLLTDVALIEAFRCERDRWFESVYASLWCLQLLRLDDLNFLYTNRGPMLFLDRCARLSSEIIPDGLTEEANYKLT